MANHFLVLFHPANLTPPELTHPIRGMGFVEATRQTGKGHTRWEWQQPALAHRELSNGYPLSPEDPKRGEWSALTFDGTRWLARSAMTQTEHLYWSVAEDLVFVSNRATLIAHARRRLGLAITLDRQALAAIVTKSYPCCTEDTAFKEVRWLGDATLSIDPHTRQVMRTPHDPLAITRGEHDAPIDWDRLAGHLLDNLSWLDDFASLEKRAAITGGKDSRLVLAALHASGRASSIDSFYISAPEGHADAEVAAQLAAHLALPFERVEAQATARSLDEVLPRHVRFTEGMLNAWDLKFVETSGRCVGIHGLLGEVYRQQAPHPCHSGQSAARHFYADNENLGQIVNTRIHDAQQRAVAQWFDALHTQGMPWEWAPDLFYLHQRIPRWVGQAKLHDALWGIHFNPLFHQEIANTYYRLPEEDRAQERIHYELMARLSPELTARPFSQSTWHPAMVARSSRPEITVATQGIPHRSGTILGTGWALPTLQREWLAARERIIALTSSWHDTFEPARVSALLAVAEHALGLGPASARASSLSVMRSPVLYARAKKNPKKFLQTLYGLLTLSHMEELFQRM